MSIEFQIRSEAVTALVSHSVRSQLRTACLPAFAGYSVDHIDVVPGGATVGMFSSQNLTPTVRVALDVFIVSDIALFAKPNDTPDGALKPAGRVTPSWQVSAELKPPTVVQGVTTRAVVLRFVPEAVDLGALKNVPGINAPDIEQRLLALMPTLQMDLTPLLSRLGLPAPNTADVVVIEGVLALRLDATQAAHAHLAPGLDWGAYVSGPTVERILLDRLVPIVKRFLPQADISARYEAVAGVPRVVAEVSMTVESDLIPKQWRAAANVGAGLSLVQPAPVLRASVDWSFHIFADLVPGLLEGLAESVTELIVDGFMDPALFGATRTGDRAFFFDLPLPALAVSGAQLRFDALVATADGMTLGGAIRIATLAERAFSLRVRKLGLPLRIQLCSELARVGSGAPSRAPRSIYNTDTYGSISITGCGVLCSITYRSPPEPASAVRGRLSGALLGVPLEEAVLSMRIPYFIAQQLNGPLTLVVRTPRGVRCVDLGRAPAVQTDANGVFQDQSGRYDWYFDDCFYVVPRSGAGAVAGMTPDDFKTRPIEEPGWAVMVSQVAGLVVQLVTVQGLQAGELLRYRSATHAIDVIADAAGRAVLPAMLPLAPGVAPALLVRANGQSVAGMVQVESAVFERVLSLPGRLHPGLSLTAGGKLRVATRSRQAFQLHTVSPLGLSTVRAVDGAELALNPQPLPPASAPGNSLAALNPQPLPPVETPERVRAWGERFGLRGLAQVFAVPGHASAHVAVAVMDNGSKLMLDLQQAGCVRVAGTFAGPIGAFDVAGSWAVADAGRQVAVFRRLTAAPMACCGSEAPRTAAASADASPTAL